MAPAAGSDKQRWLNGGARGSVLAVLGCDWIRMKAVDILAIVSSFVPPGGAVRKVTVYPSDIGLAAMAAEESSGPNMEQVNALRWFGVANR
jgi:hypothetical protein